MIIVTGTPRSRTSLMMQLLEALGISYVGEKYIDKDVLYKYNKNGLYEIPNDSVYGVKKDIGGFNRAVKIVLPGLFANHTNGFKGTSISLLKSSQLLWCLRKPIEVALSVKKIYSKNEVSPSYWLFEVGMFLNWLKTNTWLWDQITLVDTGDLIKYPQSVLYGIVKLMSIRTTQENFNKAISLIKPKETVDSNLEWSLKHKKQGLVADTIFQKLKEGTDKSLMEATKIIDRIINVS